MHTDAEFARMLEEKGIRPSVQRIAVLKFMHENLTHPTAENAFENLSLLYPTLSRTTVYNTLHLLSTKGLLSALGIEDGELRYDADTSPHIHFKCTECGRVFDIRDESQVPDLYQKGVNLLPEGFRAGHIEMCIWGKCRECTDKGTNS